MAEQVELPLVYIRWVDSAVSSGWHTLDTIVQESSAVEVQSIGWLLVDTDEQKTIVAHMYLPDEHGDLVQQGSDPMTIPTSQVRTFVRLNTAALFADEADTHVDAPA
jgi:hypothetical protein